jgi:hypothetical protein
MRTRPSLRGFFLPVSSEKVASLENCLSRRMRQMAKFEVTKIEEQGNGRLLFKVRAYTSEGRIEFPIGIQDLGSPALDELAVLRSTLGVADELAASIRLRLEPPPGS